MELPSDLKKLKQVIITIIIVLDLAKSQPEVQNR